MLQGWDQFIELLYRLMKFYSMLRNIGCCRHCRNDHLKFLFCMSCYARRLMRHWEM